MNSRQLQYAVMLSETGSFSKLAERLNITQPALSKQILALENELGVKLFNRTSTLISPTPAGAQFLKRAKEILWQESEVKKLMLQYKSDEKGELTIGITPFRGSYIMPDIIKKLAEKFNGLNIKLIEQGTEQLRHDATNGSFDLCIINLPVDESVFNVTPLEPDRLVLVVPNKICLQKGLNPKKIKLTDCADIPFVVVSATQEMRRLYEKLCRDSQISPPILAEVTGLITALEIARSGVAATLLPRQFVDRRGSLEDVTLVELHNKFSMRQPAVITKKGQFVSKFAEYAIELLKGNK